MIIKRNRKRALFINGYESEEKGQHDVYDNLKRYIKIPLDNAHIPSDPAIGIPKFESIDLSKYEFVIGFSMGGMYAGSQNDIPRVLINPAYGCSVAIPSLKPIEKKYKEYPETIIFFSDNDKYKDVTHTGTLQRLKKIEDIHRIPGKHVPTKEEIRDFIAPEINTRN